MGDVLNAADTAGREAEDSNWLDYAVRAGLVAYGVVHLIVAWLAVQLALGDQSGSASSKGALQSLAGEPFGLVAIWLIAVGMILLVVWRILEAYAGHREAEGGERVRKRLTSLLKAVLYGSIGFSAMKVAVGAGSGGGGSDSMTAKLMDLPAGQWLVGVLGLVIIGYGVNLVRRAWTEDFRGHLTAGGKSGDVGTAYIWLGKLGYAAKGISIGLVGGLFVYASVTHEAKKSGGLDQALHTVLAQPFGQVMLIVIAVGIASYGLFCFARARHLSR